MKSKVVCGLSASVTAEKSTTADKSLSVAQHEPLGLICQISWKLGYDQAGA
jgi:hypothetical protein